MRIGVITLFPELVASIETAGVVGRAFAEQRASLQCWNPRAFTEDRHQTVDDRPYGGGPGMVMSVKPLAGAVEAARKVLPEARVIYMSPQGKPVRQDDIERLAGCSEVILLAGRYEGVDERFLMHYIDEEWSLGDFVLSGGELAAMAVIDATVRLLPGVLGHQDSAAQDSFSEGLLDCPHYTRPEQVCGEAVPAELLSGNHALIARWRLKQSLGRTWLRRPDLLDTGDWIPRDAQLQKGVTLRVRQDFDSATSPRVLDDDEKALLQEFLDEL